MCFRYSCSGNSATTLAFLSGAQSRNRYTARRARKIAGKQIHITARANITGRRHLAKKQHAALRGDVGARESRRDTRARRSMHLINTSAGVFFCSAGSAIPSREERRRTFGLTGFTREGLSGEIKLFRGL